jgi:hypothetical protein
MVVGLDNVNNTSDASKPISTATQAALDLIANLAAPIASPTFTGTATAPTINATTALKVGGIDISTIYQTISGMSSYITSSSLATSLTSYLTTATATSTYAPKATPTFTGTATAPTINATTALQVNGTNINTIYQTISNMSSYLTTTAAAAAYAALSGATFTGTVAAPTINASTSLQVGGASIDTIYQPKFWVCCIISYGSSSASVSVNKNSKAASVTVAWATTGTYTITSSNTPSSTAPTAVFASIRHAIGTINWSGLSATGVAIYTTNTSGGGANYNFSLMVVL